MHIPRCGNGIFALPHRVRSAAIRGWSAALVAGLCVAAAGCGDSGAAVAVPDDRAAAAASVSSAVAALTAQSGLPSSVITLDVAQVGDCTALAWTLTPMLTSLGDLSAEEANRLDQSVINEIGTFLDAIEVRRKALACDEAGWKVARCDALMAADTSMAAQMAVQFCSAGSVGSTAPAATPTGPTTTPTTTGPATSVTATTSPATPSTVDPAPATSTNGVG